MTNGDGRDHRGSEASTADDAGTAAGFPDHGLTAWLAPRRSMLPTVYVLASTWLVPLHLFGGRNVLGGDCRTIATCLDHALVLVPATFLVGLPVTYVVATILTGVLERRTDALGAAPSVFSPPDGVHRLLVGLGGLWLVALFAGGYGAVLTPLGVALVYVLHYPLFAVAMLTPLLSGVTGPTSELLVVAGTFVAVTAGEVGWLYVLAYSVQRAWSLVVRVRRRVAADG